MLNAAKGPSVRAPRAQCDKKAYQFRLKHILEAQTGLGMSLSGVKKAAERLRADFGRLLREEVADTVRDPAEVDAELRYLIELLRR